MDASRYLVITPVKDEARYVRRTLESIAGQTVRPVRWIIVDDGSRDETPLIVTQFAAEHPWIELHPLGGAAHRQPGSAVIDAFNRGLALAAGTTFDFVVKVDGDLNLPPRYFEEMLARFREDPSLGIASGLYCEFWDGVWHDVSMPDYHAAGAAKMVRAACFEQIGGFLPARGWDTVDEIKAQHLGWKTRHFPELRFEHLKQEGSGIGTLRTNVMLGEIYRRTGGGAVFFAAKLLHRAVVARPRVACACAMGFGYLRSWARRQPLLVSPPEARHYRSVLNRRMLSAVRRQTRLPHSARGVEEHG